MFAKVMFLHMSVILFMGGGGGGAVSPGPYPGGKVEGSGWGGSGPIPGRRLGVWLGGGVSRPISRGVLGGLARGVQAQVGVNPSMHRGRRPLSRWLLLRTVRILLECILVIFLYTEVS